MTKHIYTIEDDEKQALRRRLRRAPGDPLAERARLITFWKKCAETNRHYLPHNGCWCWIFYYQNPTWRKLVMPRVRVLLDERDRQEKERMEREMRADAARYRYIRDNHETRGRAMEIVYGMNGSDWNAAIDAALAANGKP